MLSRNTRVGTVWAYVYGFINMIIHVYDYGRNILLTFYVFLLKLDITSSWKLSLSDLENDL